MSELTKEQELRLVKEKGYAILKVVVSHDTCDEFKLLSSNAFQKHNRNILMSQFPDSGVDLRIPVSYTLCDVFKSQFINLGLRTSMTYNGKPSAFLIHPRSSISKMPLMLANHTGIIDSGYRGPLIAAFRLLPHKDPEYTIEKYTRLVQICHPSLCPVYIIECSECELGETERGDGGFGSTGK